MSTKHDVIQSKDHEISMPRTSENIAAEILAIREHTRSTLQTIAVGAAIEIGKRLKEAKSLVPYGGWGDWLKDNLDYSDRTAQNLMKLAEESEKAGFKPLLDLSYTQAVQLIGLPAVDREEFLAENDVEDMSTRELQERIRAFEEEKAGLQLTIEKLEDELEDAHSQKTNVDELSAARREAEAVKQEYEITKAELARMKTDDKSKQKTITRLEEQLKAAEQVSIKETQALAQAKAEVPESVQQELERLWEQERVRAAAEDDARAAMKREGAEFTFRALYDQVKAGFEKLVDALAEMGPEKREQYRTATLKALESMKGRVDNVQ